MRDGFKVHLLTDEGKAKATQIAEAFDELAADLELICPGGREMSIVMTKLEEACFFAKKSMAKFNSQP